MGFKARVDAPCSALLVLLVCNGSSESTLIAQVARAWSQLDTLVWWGYCKSDCPMSLLRLLTEANLNPGPHSPKPNTVQTELSWLALIGYWMWILRVVAQFLSHYLSPIKIISLNYFKTFSIKDNYYWHCKFSINIQRKTIWLDLSTFS